MNLDELRRYALELADAADAVSLAQFGSRTAAERKADGTLVTVADRGVEAALRERISADFPDHAILGEEEGGGLEAQAPTWVIDPIDATNNFLRRIPVWATLIAVVVGREPLVGVVSAPALGERWDAVAGGGARRNGEPVHVSDVDDLARAQLLHGGLDWWRRTAGDWDLLGRLADVCWRTRGFGDFWMHLLVAGGMAEVALERDLKVWDIAAVECIVTAAGGRVTGYDGRPALEAGEALTTNGLLHQAVLDRIVAASPPP
jgi:histidinol-phosphatase